MTLPTDPSSLLGRVYVPDARDANFPASVHLASLAPAPTVLSRTYIRGPIRVDQGQHGYCVGYAGSNWKQCSPIRTPVTNQTGTDDYMACKQVDGLPPNGSDGTYDRALMKVYVAQGIIDRYLWATTPEELKNWILMVGPVMVGTPWYGSMFNPDAKGLVTISGTVAGGHEYLVRGWSNTAKKYRCSNSWGAGWGIDGDFWIREADLVRLIFSENGDACCAVQKLA